MEVRFHMLNVLSQLTNRPSGATCGRIAVVARLAVAVPFKAPRLDDAGYNVSVNMLLHCLRRANGMILVGVILIK